MPNLMGILSCTQHNMQCLKCKSSELTVVKTEYGKNLVCFNCASQMGSLFYFLQKQEIHGNTISQPQSLNEPSLPCPKCAANFEKRVAANIRYECLIDVCYKCGLIWYDKAELEELFHVSLRPASTGAIKNESNSPAGAMENAKRQATESEETKKKAMILAIHKNSGLTPQEKAKVIDFIVNGPPKPPLKRKERRESSWLDIFDSDGGDDGGDGDGD
jgi:Zn-finger nucleic acid-binding protein